MNEHGSTTFFGLFLLLTFTLIGLQFSMRQVSHLQSLRDKQQILLCAKELNDLTRGYVQQMEGANKVLLGLTLGHQITTVIPGLKLITHLGTKAMINSLKLYQRFRGVLFLKKKLGLFKNACQFWPLPTKTTPYKSLASLYHRDKFNRAIKDKNQWSNIMIKGKYRLKNQYLLKETLSITSQLTQEKFFSKSLSF